MRADAFHTLINYISVVTTLDYDKSTEAPDMNDVIERAMNMLNADQLAEISTFIDHVLSTTHDPKALARLFNAGNSYRVWRSDQGPRTALLAIKDAALAAAVKPAVRSSAG